MSSKSVIPFDPNLVSQSVNFHGHNLLKQLVSENAAQIHTIKLQDIDYKEFQNRTAELRSLGYGRAKEMIEFIASKCDMLLVAQPPLPSLNKKENEDSFKDRYKYQLPFEYFMKLPKQLRLAELINFIKEGDILYTEVFNYLDTTCTLLRMIAFDEGKHRYLLDVRSADLKILLKKKDTIVSKPDEDTYGRWMIGTRLRVEVLSVSTNPVTTIQVGTKGATLSENQKDKIKLGKILMSELPKIISVTPDPSIKYLSQCIEKMESFKNPQCIKLMATQSNIDLRWYPSLISGFRNNYPEKEQAKYLRKVQMCKWAHKNVAEGVTHFKKGQHEEAFQCLNKALQIDPENVEAFVAKGALLANLGRYEKAIEDFDKSLQFNPNHANARKYMCETLVELGKQNEEKEKFNEAHKCYSRCLELNEEHETAKKYLNAVSSKLGIESDFMKFIKDESKEEEDFLSDLLQIENELNKKRNNAAVPVNNSAQAKEEDKDVIIIKDVEEESTSKPPTEAPLSPLSQKLVLQNQQWAPPSANNNIPPPYMMNAVPPPVSEPPVNLSLFSNPPPAWPGPLTSKPPLSVPPEPIERQNTYTEDPTYRARVEQFLKQLEAPGTKTRNRSRDRSLCRRQSKYKGERRKRKRRRSSSSSSSTSSSSSSSSSSSNRSSSCSSLGHKSSKESKKYKKRTRSKKSSKRNKKKKNKSVSEMQIPNFEDLEEKLMAYYKKMEEMNKCEELSKASESPKTKFKATENPVSNKLKLTVHPAFLDNDSEEEDHSPTKVSKKPPQGSRDLSKGNLKDSKKDSQRRKKRKSPSCSSSSISITSRSRSYSSSSYSRSRSRSRSKISGRYRSDSKPHYRSRSKLGYHKRYSRSRSRNRYRKSRSASRSRSRSHSSSKSRVRHRSYSRSKRSPSPQKKPRSRSPFSYYGNKPFYSNRLRTKEINLDDPKHKKSPPPRIKTKSPSPKPTLASPKQSSSNRKEDTNFKTAIDEAKRRIHQHLASNNKDLGENRNKGDKLEGENLEWENKPVDSPDPSTRFGKWAAEVDTKTERSPKGEKSEQSPIKLKLDSTLDQYEDFLQKGREKNKELLKERNKAFLKPNVD